jgi:hypothetical protein
MPSKATSTGRGSAADHRFASAWLKWGQAVLHAEALHADIAAAAKPDVWCRAEYIPRRHGFSIIPEMTALPPARWSLLLGDIASNYRAALDHLAWALVGRGSSPPDTLTEAGRRRIGFPVCDTRADFNDVVLRRLPGARRSDVAKVRAAQPYHHGARKRPLHSFRTLVSVSNSDKHRTIEPIWAFPVHVHLTVVMYEDCSAVRFPPRGTARPVEAGQEMAFVRVRKTGPSPSLNIAVDVTPEPCLERNVSVTEWCRGTTVYIRDLLREFSGWPPEMTDLDMDVLRPWLRLDRTQAPSSLAITPRRR